MKKLGVSILLLLSAAGSVTWRANALNHLVPQVSAQGSVSADESVCANQGKNIDLLQYMRPSALNGGGSGKSFGLPGCRVTAEGINEAVTSQTIQVVSKPITGEPSDPLPADIAQTGFLLQKGGTNNEEWWFYDNSNVYLYQDISWENTCTDNGVRAMYREQNTLPGEPVWGGPYKRCLSDGESTSATHRYLSYESSSNNVCTVDWGGDVGENYSMEQGVTFRVTKVVDNEGNYLAEEGIAPNIKDTIMVELTGGPGAGEKRFYSRGWGLTGYYAAVGGKVMFHVRASANGEELPTTCSGEEAGSIFGKKRDENNKVMWPIEELPEALEDKDYIKAGQILANEGYAAKCVAQFSAKTEWGGEYAAWIDQHPGETLRVPTRSQENFDASGGKLPFVRDDEESVALNASVENYMSVLNGKNQGLDEYEEKLAQSPAISLLTKEQQYHLKEFNLHDRKAVCDYYPTATPCPLWQPEPGAIHDLEDTYTYMMQYKITGRRLAHPYGPDITVSEAEFNGLRERFDEVPTDMQRADDLSFVVLVKELPKDHKEGLVAWFSDIFNTNKLFNYISPLSPEEIKADPYDNENNEYKRDTVAAIAFPVPAFNINTSFEHYQLQPATWTAKQALTPMRINQQDQGLEEARRDINLQKTKMAQAIAYDSDKRNINPIGKAFFAPDGEDYDPMTRALVDFADDSASGCQGLVAEGAKDMKYSTTYSESDNYITKTGFSMFSDIFTEVTGNLSPLSSAVNLNTNAYLGEGADEIRDADEAYIKAIVVTRIPEKDWGEKMKNAYLTQNQLTQLSEDLADYHIAAAAVGDDPAAIDAVTASHKILGDKVPYKKDLTLENFYNWGSEKAAVEFVDLSKCTDESGARIEGASCLSTLTASVVAKTPGVGLGDFGRTLNEVTSLVALVSAPYKSARREHIINSKNPEEYLTGASGRKGQAESDKGADSTSSRPKPVAACDGGSRITSGEGAVHYCTDSGRACTPTAGQCTYMDASNNVGNWKSSSDPTMACADLIPYAACTYKGSLLGNMVNSQGQFDPSGTKTACEYVVETAQSPEYGISPRLALAIWGEESGFGSIGGAMFGYNPPNSSKHFDLDYQLKGMLGLAKAAPSYEAFMLKYSSANDLTNGTFCTNPHFPGRVKDYYNYLGPGR